MVNHWKQEHRCLYVQICMKVRTIATTEQVDDKQEWQSSSHGGLIANSTTVYNTLEPLSVTGDNLVTATVTRIYVYRVVGSRFRPGLTQAILRATTYLATWITWCYRCLYTTLVPLPLARVHEFRSSYGWGGVHRYIVVLSLVSELHDVRYSTLYVDKILRRFFFFI